MDSKTLALRCRELADDKKADNLLILDMRKLSSVADFFVLATGGSEPHLRAIVSEISDKLAEEHGLSPRASEGLRQSNWAVLDYGDVIVHVMRPEVRDRYDLEGLWGDAPRLRVRAAGAGKRSLVDGGGEPELGEIAKPKVKAVRRPRAAKPAVAAPKVRKPRAKAAGSKRSASAKSSAPEDANA